MATSQKSEVITSITQCFSILAAAKKDTSLDTYLKTLRKIEDGCRKDNKEELAKYVAKIGIVYADSIMQTVIKQIGE